MIRFLLWIVLISIQVSSYGGTRDPNTPDEKYIEYGKKFKCVLRICGKYKNEGSQFCASAVALNRHWIITAAHVVNGAEYAVVKDDDNETHELSKIVIHKDFNDDNFGMHDIAVAYTETPIDLDFFPELYKTEDEVGKICGISGFGITGTFSTGSQISDGQRRAGSNIIDSIEKNMLMCSPSRSFKERRTTLEFLISNGDSGGGLFIDKKLAGINSCVLASDKNPNASYGDEAGHTRISKYVDWIELNIK